MTLEAREGGGLLDLAERCEQATGPDRELLLEIAVALDMRPDWLTRGHGELWIDARGRNPILRWADISIGRSSGNPSVDDPPNFLASIDAALTLYVSAPARIPSNPRLASAEALRQRAEFAQ